LDGCPSSDESGASRQGRRRTTSTGTWRAACVSWRVLQFSWESLRLASVPSSRLGPHFLEGPLRTKVKLPCGIRSPSPPAPLPQGARGEEYQHSGRVHREIAACVGKSPRSPQGAACKSPPLSPCGRGVGGEGPSAPSHLVLSPKLPLGTALPRSPASVPTWRARSSAC